RDTEQTKVRKIITDVQRAAEEKDIRTILGHLSRTYRDPQGYDYNGILNFCNNALKWYWFYEIIASRYGSFPGVAGQIR
ncbi:MAG TPA: hypothetical protein VFG02_03215, partial [Nitrospirota bacterium]|nr:hypothetical protein [Nitrospirota bacterium]